MTAPVRSGTDPAALASTGTRVVTVDFHNAGALQDVLHGADRVVSALNSLEDIVIDLQGRVLDAAIAAGVPCFIPSSYSLDFTRTRPGRNRNRDLRRHFMTRIDAAPVRAASILSGAFADLLAGQAPIVLRRPRIVLHWSNPDQPLDFTNKDGVAFYAAAAVRTTGALRRKGSLRARTGLQASSAIACVMLVGSAAERRCVNTGTRMACDAAAPRTNRAGGMRISVLSDAIVRLDDPFAGAAVRSSTIDVFAGGAPTGRADR